MRRYGPPRRDKRTLKNLNAWEVGQIIEGLKGRAEKIRRDARECDRAAKDGNAGDGLRLAAQHIDSLIDKIDSM